MEVAEVFTYGFILSTPNDTYYNLQKNLNESNDYDIDASEGWDIENGDDSIIIAIVDVGVDINHEDLDGNIWTNPGETPGNSIDDDGNDLTDDYYGWDFYADDNDVTRWYHGTKVAGVAAAEMNNSTGVASIAGGWGGGGVKLMSLGTSSNGTYIDAESVQKAVEYAVSKGANVINCSFGCNDISSVMAAFDTAHVHGIVVVGATGDGGVNNSCFPARYDSVISVGACMNGHRTPTSNFGRQIGCGMDVVAPSGDSQSDSIVITTAKYDNYEVGCQTSISAAEVSGLAALLLSFNSSLTPDEITEIICKSTDKIGDYPYNDWANAPYGGWNDSLGYGRINAYKALFRAKGYGTLSTDVTWYNDIELSDDIVVPSGKTLTIDEGVTVRFANSKKLEVSGTLTVADNVTFTRVSGGTYWSGIDIKSSGVMNVNGDITIEYATTALDIENSSGISNGSNRTTIQNCATRGITVTDCDPTVDYFTIRNSEGIRITGSLSDVTIDHVTVSVIPVTNYWGFYFDSSTDGDITSVELNADSLTFGCIYVGNSAYIDATASNIRGIEDRSGDEAYAIVFNASATGADAVYNYWGYYPIDANDLTNIIGKLDPSSAQSSAFGGAGKITSPLVFETHPIREAKEYERYGNWREALTRYNTILTTSDNLIDKRRAIKGIYHLNRRQNISFDDLRASIYHEQETPVTWYSAFLDYVLCNILIQEGKYEEAISELMEKSVEYTGTPMEVEMLTQIAKVYGNELNDKEQAKVFADRAAEINPGCTLLESAYSAAGIDYDPMEYVDKFGYQGKNVDSQPDEKLFSDSSSEYVEFSPNPFNPVTNITYSINKTAPVTIEVFAINGQKVANLVDGMIEAGTHSVRFDATNLASGVYFYRFKSPEFKKTGKMLLVR